MSDEASTKGVKKFLSKHMPGIASGLGMGIQGAGLGGMAMGGVAIGGGMALGRGVASAAVRTIKASNWIYMFIIASVITWLNFVWDSFYMKIILFTVFFFSYYYLCRDAIEFHSFIKKAIWLSVLGIFAPTIGGWIEAIPMNNLFVESFTLILLIVGYLGPIFAITIVHHEDNAITRVLSFLLVTLILVFAIASAGDVLAQDNFDYVTGVISSQQQTTLKNIFVKVGTTLAKIPGASKLAIFGGINKSKELFNQSVHFATTGQTYEENIDSHSQVQSLGVAYTSIELTAPDGQFLQGDPVSAWAVLESKSLDEDIDVSNKCFVKPSRGEAKPGNINQPTFTIFDEDIRDLLCNFPKDSFPDVGSYVLSLVSNFDYTTSGYLRRYFISQTDLTNIRQTGEDPELYFGIDSEDQDSTFTNGPISLAIIKHGLLQAVGDAYNEFVLGFRIDNNRKYGMEGNLQDVQSFVISLPEGMALKSSPTGDGFECTADFEPYSRDVCLSDCYPEGVENQRCINDCNSFNMYELSGKDDFVVNDDGTIKMPFLVSCNIEIRNPDRLLDNDLIGIKNFRANVDYTYEVAISKSFTVLEKDDYVPTTKLSAFCGYKTAYRSYVGADASAVVKLAKQYLDEDFWTEPLGSGCDELVKSVAAFRYRRGKSNVPGIGVTGITLDQASRVMSVDATSLKNNAVNAEAFMKYMDLLITEECTVDGIKQIDCALNKFLMNEKNPAPAVIQMAVANEW